MKKVLEILLKSIGFIIWHMSWLQRFLIHVSGNKFRILYYHMVADKIPDYYFRNKGVSVEDFKKQIKFYKKYYKFISLDEAIQLHQAGDSLKGYICLTTDDGFKENYTTIAPILIEEQIPATFFILPEMIDNHKLMWRNKLVVIHNSLKPEDTYHLISTFAQKENLELPYKKEGILKWSERVFPMKEKDRLSDELWKSSGLMDFQEYMNEQTPYLSKEQLLKLHELGFSLGSHTLSHPYCNKLEFSELVHEIVYSSKLLTDLLNHEVRHFAYPFGTRPKADLEAKLVNEESFKIVSLSGISNYLDNEHPLKWERDQQETSLYLAMFRFFVLPFLRKVIRKK